MIIGVRLLPLLILLSACASTSVCNRADQLDCGKPTASGEPSNKTAPQAAYPADHIAGDGYYADDIYGWPDASEPYQFSDGLS
jgi:hypothetical protein